MEKKKKKRNQALLIVAGSFLIKGLYHSTLVEIWLCLQAKNEGQWAPCLIRDL